MGLLFEWDPDKAASNRRKHGVSFEEAGTAFADPRSITIHDAEHSAQEERLVLVGMSQRRRLLVVVHTERSDGIRIISARRATLRERLQYEHG